MTNEQINIAIAESLGEIDPRYTTTGGFIASYVINGVTVGFHGLPNYTADLNACHEMVRHLTDDEYAKYSQSLLQLVGSFTRPRYHDATARQRCEAYLRTIGKWIE